MILSLLALSIGSLFVLHLFSERALLARIRDYTEELSTAIEIAQEQPAGGADLKRAVQAYAEKLRKLGVRDVSIADASAEVVQASTNPRIVGKKLARRRGPAEYVIRGVLGEEGPLGRPPTTSNLTVPIVVGDRRVGYVVITRILDDFSELSQTALATASRRRSPSSPSACCCPSSSPPPSRAGTVPDGRGGASGGGRPLRPRLRGRERRGRRAGQYVQPDGGAARGEPGPRGAAARR